MPKDEVKCPWCSHVMLSEQAKVIRPDKRGTVVIERRCTSCGKLLAAYIETEHDFFPRIRSF